MKSRLFIGSSKENLGIAYAAQQNLHDDAETTVWTQGVFELSATGLESIIKQLGSSDFGMFIFSPDDVLIIRKNENQAVRDNVILELGLFLGHLGKNRCFILVPDEDADLRIPTDLIGVTPAKYETGRSDANLQAATGPACNSIREAIRQIGPRGTEPEAPDTGPRQPEPTSRGEAVEIGETSSDGERKDMEWLNAIIGKDYENAIRLLEAKIPTETDEEELAELETWDAFAQYQIDPKKGTQRFEEVLLKYPSSCFPYDLFAFSKAQHDLYSECLEVLETGISKVTNNAPLILEKVRYLRVMGRDEDANTILREAISQSPEEPHYYESLADYHIQSEDYPAARSCLEKGLSVIPNNRLLLFKYAKLLHDHIDKRYALVPYNQLLNLFPDDSKYLTLRSNIYLELDLNDLAMRDYQRANELAKQKQGWIIANIGNLYKNRGFYRESIKWLQSALESYPESQYAHERISTSIKLRDDEAKKLSGIVKVAKQELLALRSNSNAENPDLE